MKPYPFDDLEGFRGLRVTVMGLGVFGGGGGVTRFLVDRGAEVTVTDLRSPEALSKGLEQIADLPVRLVLEEHREEDFRFADLVIANPAVPPDSPFLELAAESGVPVDTEMNLTFRLLPSRRVAGVTGSNGKTTTSHLLYHMVRASGERAWLGGNVGGSLLPRLSEIREEDVVVLELSSFQLERSGRLDLGPGIGIITNITPNHLDRHGDFESYIQAKAQILVKARGAVLNADDEVSVERFSGLRSEVIWFSSRKELEEGFFLRNGSIVERMEGREKEMIALKDVQLPGRFNLENIMTALAGLRLIRGGAPASQASLSAAASFQGVPHRLELVCCRKGVRYVNDSIATTPLSCQAALEAVEGAIHLIAGGYDKKLPLDTFADEVARKTERVYLLGETGRKLESMIRDAAVRSGVQGPGVKLLDTLEQAVVEAAKWAAPGSTVLLSPGFASYDQFLNFEERGECFRRHVADLGI